MLNPLYQPEYVIEYLPTQNVFSLKIISLIQHCIIFSVIYFK